MSVRKLALMTRRRVDSSRPSQREGFSLRRYGASLLAAVVCCCTALSTTLAVGQEAYLPTHDPRVLDADYAWFEPIYDMDLLDMTPKRRANTGWYGAVDKMYLWGKRPSNEAGHWMLDRGRGHRFDAGYMLSNDSGFSFTFMDYSINAFDGFNRERLNRLALLDEETGLPEDLPLAPPFGQPQIVEDDNNFGFTNRFIEVRNSENVADFNSFELNKTWRLEPYHYGGILEPLVGVRYIRFRDTFQRMTLNIDQFFRPGTDPIEEDFLAGEQVLTERSIATNDLVGGQLGFRYYKHVNRWRYSAELRFFSLGSFQSNRLQSFEELTLYEDETVDPEDEVQHFIEDQSSPIIGKSNGFAWGYDIRAEASYTLTRMIELRGGFQLIDIAQGIWRGRLIDPTSDRNQRAIMAGFTFGAALNR